MASQTEAGRADTRQQADPYRLQLSDQARDHLAELLGGRSLHFAIGFLIGAVTVPEPLSFVDCVELLKELAASDEDIDEDESLDDDSGESEEMLSISTELESSLRPLFDAVSQRVADGAVASLIPIADDAAACDDWITGLHEVVAQTLHEVTHDEAEVALRVFAQRVDDKLTRDQRKERARKTLATDVLRLIQLWSEVPPFDPKQDDLRWSEVVPKRVDDEPQERVIHTGGTFVRAQAKVGRNDLCPCGSGKKYKKCCG
jgi:hypothetical protein